MSFLNFSTRFLFLTSEYDIYQLAASVGIFVTDSATIIK